MAAENKKYIVGDLVVCNPEHPKIKADKMDEGWTVQYYKFLRGHTAHIVECICVGELSYKLQIDGDTFYTEDESEMILWTPGVEIKLGEAEHTGGSVSALDKQVSGDHYKDCKIQPVEYIHANGLSYLEGNVIKYTTRHSKKNGKADIEKAIHYLELILEMEYKES